MRAARIDVDAVGEALRLIQSGPRGETRREGEITFQEAQRENMEKVMPRHCLRDCAELPCPLNRYG